MKRRAPRRPRVAASALPLGVLGVLVAVLLVVLSSAATPALGADATTCRVRNVDRGTVRRSLPRAVADAKPGDHLVLRGRCVGLTVVDRDLSIQGVRTASGAPIAAGAFAGTVLTVQEGVRLVIRDLIIRNGVGPGMPGGGIVNRGVLALRGATLVTGNRETAVLNDGVLRMYDTSAIRANTGGHSGGGVYGAGLLELHDRSAIEGNQGADGAGGIWNASGVVRLFDHAAIRGNTCTLGGGGIANFGTLVLDDASSIRGNTAATGGGVLNGGTLVLKGASRIAKNTAGEVGGGVANMGTLRMRGTSAIVLNEATMVTGGGIWNDGGTLVDVRCAPAADANVLDNAPNDCADAAEP